MSGYLKLRGNTWHLRLQSWDPVTGKPVDFGKSLRTSDKLQAEILAAPFVAAHKQKILDARPRVVTEWVHFYEPGRVHSDGNGGQIIATPELLTYVNHNGCITKTRPNGRNMVHLEGNIPGVDVNAPAPARYTPAYLDALDKLMHTAPKAKANTADDDSIIDLYIDTRGFKDGSQAERETRQMWGLYKSLIGKPLAKATRDDGRKLVAHLEARGDKSATCKKKIGRLAAACNIAIDEQKLSFNPFAKVAKLKDDATKRAPFDDADVAIMFANIDKLSAPDQLLLRVISATGMRLGEAHEIDREYSEKGVRFVVVGTKTKASKRRVPLPASLLPYLPEKITAPLFPGDSNQASTRLGVWLDETCGIDDPQKVAGHSWRHRAKDVLRAEGCPEKISEELFGRDKVTVGDGYGKGHPVVELKKWIDKLS